MLDHPSKTAELLARLKALVPFEVEVAPAVIKQLQDEHAAVADNSRYVVSDISYAGDEGGLVCHMETTESEGPIIISLTYVRVARSMPFATAVLDYQKHRVKKLRKQGQR